MADLESKARAAQETLDQFHLKSKEIQSEIDTQSRQAAEISQQITDKEGQQAAVVESLQSARNALDEIATKRKAEEETLGNAIARHQEISAEVERLRQQATEEEAKISHSIASAQKEEARLGEVQRALVLAEEELEKRSQQKAEIEASLVNLKSEQESLQSSLPEWTTKLTSVTAAVATLVAQRDEASAFLAQAKNDFKGGQTQMEELTLQLTSLQDQHKKAVFQADDAEKRAVEAEARVQAIRARYEEGVKVMEQLDQKVEQHRKLAEQTAAQTSKLEAEMQARIAQLEAMKKEEARLGGSLASLREKVEATDADLVSKQNKIRAAEAQFSEVTQSGGRLMSISEALSLVEQRQQETTRSLQQASQEELALQVKISNLLDSHNRELARLEQVKKSRVTAEEEGLMAADEIRKRIAAFEKAEADRAAQVRNVEARLGQLAALEQKGNASVEALRAELIAMESRKSDFAKAEMKMRQWQEIEKRLHGQLAELEEKHEVMRLGLTTDESTVVMFATDLIKRLDLIDVLIQRFADSGSDGLGQQLRTLRASFEDILHQHGVTEFDVAPGTEVDVAMRYRIAIVDSVPGKSKPKVIESYRPGYIYSSPEGRETILRKVEVKTSSQ